jgi:succinoglycan biosynthesis protein ExoM
MERHMPVKSTVCVAVCTCQRPRMLERCLNSLTLLKVGDGIDLQIVVVDNDAAPEGRPIAERAAAKSPFPVHYRHEPRRGIPMARNRALDEAAALAADWLVFIDDDQTAYPDCVEKLLLVARRDNADAVAAAKIFTTPSPRPFWHVSNPDRPEDDGTAVVQTDGPVESRKRKELATNGVLLSMSMVRAMELRFDERLALGGLEDGDFFTKAHRLGAILIYSSLPTVTEERDRSRFTFWRQMQSGLARGGAYVTRYRLTNTFGRAVARYGAALVLRTLRGIGQLAISPVFIPFSVQRAKFTALEGGRNLCTAAGMLGGLFSLQFEFYRQVDGH